MRLLESFNIRGTLVTDARIAAIVEPALEPCMRRRTSTQFLDALPLGTKALQPASPERVIAGAEQPDAVRLEKGRSRVEHRAGIG